MFMLVITLFIGVYPPFSGAAHYGHNYYNGKYSGLGYTDEDRRNGLWSDMSTLAGPYLLPSPPNERYTTGCNYNFDNNIVESCTGTAVYLANLDFPNITAGTFNEKTNTITILDCPVFQFFEAKTFENLTILETMHSGEEKTVSYNQIHMITQIYDKAVLSTEIRTVQGTSLNHVPDLHYSNALKIINLAGNSVKITTANHRGWSLPSTVTHLALMDNNIYYIPPRWISGPNLKIVSFGNNQLTQIQNNVFGTQLGSLKYLGVDGNQIRRISKKSIAALATSNFIHFNISNNLLEFVQKETFSQLPALRILEVHQNSLPTVSPDTFSNMPNLEHLDLHANDIEHLRSRSFENLPLLKELRVHSQKTPMKSIAFDAWNNIDDELKFLFISDNELPSFPHPVMEEGYYPKLEMIHADNNQIANATGYGVEAFPLSANTVYKQKLAKFHEAFTTYPALYTIYLDNNLITHVANTDYCYMDNLQNLFLGYNKIKETTMDEDAFACAFKLGVLDLQANFIQYVPPCLQNHTMLPAITELGLHYNKITFLESGTFTDLPTLLTLHLDANGILAIEDETFPTQLQELFLSQNGFRFLHKYPFKDLSFLTSLRLQVNDIDYIPPDAFTGCSSLSELYLNNNNIAQLLKAHFQDCQFTGEVRFQYNDIGWIEDGTFAHFPTIGSLYLQNNKLTSLPSAGDFVDLTVNGDLDLSGNRIVTLKTEVFKNLDIGQSFNLKDNNIAIIESEAFSNVNVKSLDLTSNPLRQLNQKSFNGVTLSETLSINGLRFTEIPHLAFYDVTADYVNIENGGVTDIQSEAFYNLQVNTLNLKDNSLGTITTNIFGGSSQISEYLYLTNNGLTGLSSDAFDSVVVNYIYLDNNLLEDFPQALLSQNPSRLDLSDNLLFEFTDGPFSKMTNLRYLYLSGNKLKVIENGLFDSLTSLFYLDLGDNEIETVEDKVFDKLGSLSYLYLDNNQLTYFHTLPAGNFFLISLSGNSIETIGYNAFTSLTNLQTLYFGNNPLGCQCQLVRDLHAVKDVIESGSCSYPTKASGVLLNINSEADPMYYLELNGNATVGYNASIFQCSGENVVATAKSGTEIEVTWEQPPYLYFNETIAGSPNITGKVSYEVNCDSTTAGTLSETVKDNNAEKGTTEFTVNFDQDAGVVPGTVYECSVKMEKDGYTSAKSFPSVVITPDASLDGTNVTIGPDDIELKIIYYDFSKRHADFQDIEYLTISKPTYVASPYGAWLLVSSTPATDTFSEWYRNVTGANKEIVDSLILEAQTGTVKRFSSAEFYPVDGKGYMAEFQPDCGGTYHNFGFTSVIRTGLEFSGKEKITVGGGEAVWLYINKVLVVEFIADGNGGDNCYKIDLSPAATEGGGEIIPQVGTISGDACTGLSPLSEGVTLDLEVDEVYHFDLFHAETRMCTSEFLFEVEDTTFSQDPTVALPIDYTVTIAEDNEVGSIVQPFDLTDVFSAGPYSVTLYKGNEARQFGVEDGSYTFTPTVVEPVYLTFEDFDGNIVEYVECSGVTNITVGNDTSDEQFTVSTSSAQLFVKSELDYETTTGYYFLMTVVDKGLSPELTGYIAIRVTLTDVNDNCPVMTPTSVTLTPLPVLVKEPLVTFTSTDADSGENAKIHYVVSAVEADPPVEYDESLSLWKDVYKRYTSLLFDVHAIDNGTIPRGMSATINITVSNTCVMDVLYGKISYIFRVDNDTGGLNLVIPAYMVVDFKCIDYIGLESGIVLDTMMDASSVSSDATGPGRGRVNQPKNDINGLEGAWVPAGTGTDEYLQVNMDEPWKFTAVHTQGRDGEDEWVTSYKLQYYDGVNDTWVDYTDSTGQDIFLGNTDSSTVATVNLDPPILSDSIRINPQTYEGSHIALRLELSGCSQDEQLYYDVSCVRCETTYYCEGDGEMKMCGRCADANTTCDRNPTEHSFGLASECTSCPEGWICKDGYATPCEDYHYVEYCNATGCPAACSPCEEGYACFDGRRTKCEAGTYSTGRQEHCESCAAGTYQNQSGQGSCTSCPPGYYSAPRMTECDRCDVEEYSLADGTGCASCTSSAECPCLAGDKCFTFEGCYNTGGGHSSCEPCPDGFEGDGKTCTDIDECYLHNPCYNLRCLNTQPGYQCLECPEGYTGTYEDALAYNVHLRVFLYSNQVYSNFSHQTCEDIDECAIDNGGCPEHMPCVNTPGSFYCDFCEEGYMGTYRTGCYLSNFCISGAHKCSSTANCIYLGPGQYRCECKPGYAGNGDYCQLDSDNDGLPDRGIGSCTVWGCFKDNCPYVSNSNQEDTDGDYSGDNCDNDDDNDGRYDDADNCQFVHNWDEAHSNGDGVGPTTFSLLSAWARGYKTFFVLNSIEHEISNAHKYKNIKKFSFCQAQDNCQFVHNWDEAHSNGDGVGPTTFSLLSAWARGYKTFFVLNSIEHEISNAHKYKNIKKFSFCQAQDNCQFVNNWDQADSDGDGVGDACDSGSSAATIGDTPGGTDIDEDGDSILDGVDNCPSHANGDQSDVDGDGEGDVCDDDTDGDGVPDAEDNCVYLSNADQTDDDGNGVGDACETDSDGDGVEDKNDTCPHNPDISATSFTKHYTVDLYPSLSTTSPKWLVKDNGGEVMQMAKTGMPTLLIGEQTYGAIEYKGTWFVTDDTASDYIGFVFGYMNSQKFYLVIWRSKHYNYNDGSIAYRAGIKGVQLKLVDSDTGPSSTLADAIWHSSDTPGITTLLWQDPDLQGWEPNKSYRWYLTHRPSTGYISLQIYRGTSLMVDSGSVHDSTVRGGRVGVFQFGEFPVIWAYLKVDCLEHWNQGLYLDGKDDYVLLDDILALKMEESFTFETWLSLDSGYTTGPYPIFCTVNETVCLSVEGGTIKGHYGDATVSGGSVTGNQWYNIIFRHSVADQSLTLFLNGAQVGSTYSVPYLNFTDMAFTEDLTMYIGRQNTTFFRGTIDEIRLFTIAVPDSEITEHIGYDNLERTILKSYGNLHFKMEDSAGAGTLTNSGILSATAALTGGSFVKSFEQNQQFKVINPNNR